MKMDLVCRLILLFGASSLLPSLPTKGTEENPSLPRQNRLVWMKMDLVCRLILLFGASFSLPTKGTQENPSLPQSQNRLVDKTPKPVGNVFNKVVVVVVASSSSSRERNLGDHFLLRVSLQKSLKAARCVVFFPQKGKTPPPPSRDDVNDDDEMPKPPWWWCRLAAMEENTTAFFFLSPTSKANNKGWWWWSSSSSSSRWVLCVDKSVTQSVSSISNWKKHYYFS